MSGKKPAPKKPDDSGQAKFMETVVGFFGTVLKSIAGDDFLRVLWGVEVLLFVILALMIFFGSLTGDQRFNLALVIIASVVVTFLVSGWRLGGWGKGGDGAMRSAALEPLAEQARACMNLLGKIEAANASIIRRGKKGDGPWGRMAQDTYNHVCATCHRRRTEGGAPDAYFDTICAEPAIATVCDEKWRLGEAVDDYRDRIEEVRKLGFGDAALARAVREHAALELAIRRGVTQPDAGPEGLAQGVARAIAAAEKLV